MVTGLSCSAAVPPQLGNHAQRNLDTAHRGGGRNVWTSPGTDPRPPGGRRRGRVCDLRAGPDHPPVRNVLRPRPGAAPSAEPAAARHARCADARAGGQADYQSSPRWFPPNYRRFRQRIPGQPWTSGADIAMSAATQNPLIWHALPDDGHEVDGRAQRRECARPSPVFASLGVTMRSEITNGAAAAGGSAGPGSPLCDHPASRLIRR